MFWLLACSSPPALELPVSPPLARHGVGLAVERFVGPLDVAGLDAAALCGTPDYAALLRDGRFGWRVLLATDEGLALADEGAAVATPASAADLSTRLHERAERWAAADATAAAVCGAPVLTSVLIAADGGMRFDPSPLLGASAFDAFDVRLLVADSEIEPAVAAPAKRETGFYLDLAWARNGWAVRGSDESVPVSEHPSVYGAVERVLQAGYPEVVLTMDSQSPWSAAVEAVDALTAIGIVPTFGLVVGTKELGAPKPPSSGPGTRLALGRTVSVLEFNPKGPPLLELPVSPPLATHGYGMAVERFVGPLDVAGLDAAALCETPDYAALLESGRFGWRVLVVTAEGLALADEVAGDGTPASAADLQARLKERRKQWAAADATASAVCGAPSRTPLLLAVEGGSPFDTSVLLASSAGDGLDVRLLVTDSELETPVAAPAKREAGYDLTLARGDGGWAVLGSDDSVPGSEHPDVEGAVERVVQAGYPEVVLTIGSQSPWSAAVEAVDALAAIGIVPSLGLMVGGEESGRPKPRPSGQSTRLALGQTVSVLDFVGPLYVKPGRGRRMLLKMEGSGAPFPDVLPGFPGLFPADPLLP
ncbi:MAG: hypothetical protein Q8P18_17125 [Pseudomonadota bacterium]|nr:hypothetical protein [Pseudomonadota bacterium]